jgi:hypothetical protein
MCIDTKYLHLYKHSYQATRHNIQEECNLQKINKKEMESMNKRKEIFTVLLL